MDFKSAAREYSEAPNADVIDGAYQFDTLAEMPPVVRDRVAALKAGQSTDWIQVDEAWAKFQVIGRSCEKPMEVSNARKEMVRRQLAATRGALKRDLSKELSVRVRYATTSFTVENLQ